MSSPETRAAYRESQHPNTAALLGYFECDHLPERLQQVAAPLRDMAYQMCVNVAAGPEITAGLRKLLEAKDCFVRAAL